MARDGGRGAFDEMVRRHRSSLIAFAGSVAPPSRAEDVVQESLTKAYVALQEGAEPELLRAWLFRIVRNTAIDEQRGVRPYEQLDENYDGVEQPPQAFERREQVAGLVAAIQDLPTAQRRAIVQRELEGKGHEEIGRALKLSPGSVRQLIYRARHTLREAAGATIPVAVIRAACMPGAGEAVGGLGAAGALKLGLAAVLAAATAEAPSTAAPEATTTARIRAPAPGRVGNQVPGRDRSPNPGRAATPAPASRAADRTMDPPRSAALTICSRSMGPRAAAARDPAERPLSLRRGT